MPAPHLHPRPAVPAPRADRRRPALAATAVAALLGLVGVAAAPAALAASEPQTLTVERIQPVAGPALSGSGPNEETTEVSVVGTGFTAASTVLVGGEAVATELESSTLLTAQVPRRGPGTADVTVTDGDDTTPVVPAARFTWTGVVGTPAVRVLENRGPGTRCVDVRTAADLPSDADGVFLNVTAADATGVGYVVVRPGPDGTAPAPFPEPTGSTVNLEPGRDVANSAYVPVSPDGEICYTAVGGAVRVLLDVTGYTVPGSGVTGAPSTRLLDTRPGGVGEIEGPVPPRTVQTVQVAGVAGVPEDASSVLLNVTVTGIAAVGNLRVFPGGQDVPSTSVVNYAPGADKANATTVALEDGTVSFWSDTFEPTSTNPVQVILDVVGWTSADSDVTAIAPTRVLDTRTRTGAIPHPLFARTGYSLPVTQGGAVPEGATAVILNVTAIHPSSVGNLRVYPDYLGTGGGAPVPGSVLNYIGGRDIPNQVVVPLPPNGRVTLYNDMFSGSTEAAVDVVGYVLNAERRG
ncbi:IPT/TIG domain-containing protein [Cellulomonas sp. 179-A 9B4 NHS]|uniref:IPT/TIG domain-containing protein n=1 Tax=Cellulomonas sp. 179-A 9B4 NHS TaxID=3142379 RepID=UPI0039A2C22C